MIDMDAFQEQRTLIPRTSDRVLLYANRDFDPSSDTPVNSITYVRPEYQAAYECRIIQEKLKRKDVSTWRSFQHYDIRTVDPSLLTSDDSRIRATFYSSSWVPTHLYGELGSLATANYGYPCGDMGVPISGLPSFNDRVFGDGDIVAPPEDLDDLIVASLKVMLPKIRNELSLINSIIELKDFISLKHYVQQIRQRCLSLSKGQRGKSLRDCLRLTSDSYLQAKFNFLPLMSDAQGVYSAMSKSMLRITNHLLFEGKVRTAHFRRALAERDFDSGTQSFNSVNAPTIEPEIIWDLELFRSVSYSPSLFHAECQYIARYTDLQRAHAQGWALLDSLGVNFDPQIIWNAIPWSFVIDWFANVGEYLGRFKEGLMDPQTTIIQYLWSIKRERRIRLALSDGSLFYTSPPDNISGFTTFPEVVETAYRRQVGLPEASSFLTSGLNLTEFSLGAALVFSRGRPRKKPRGWTYKGPKTHKHAIKHAKHK